MKRKNPLRRVISQFTYDHKILNDHILRIRKATGELSGFFGDLEAKNKKEGYSSRVDLS
ncbi:MAG: hypothetical protein Q4D55_07470 [Eubacteriales bacterium]|nr:hypothetical protein [Eubacteriales bacterium]